MRGGKVPKNCESRMKIAAKASRPNWGGGLDLRDSETGGILTQTDLPLFFPIALRDVIRY